MTPVFSSAYKETYSSSGNLQSKTGVGNYAYSSGSHRLSNVDNTDDVIPYSSQSITYNAWGKVAEVNETVGSDTYKYELTYGPDLQRVLAVLWKNNSLVHLVTYGDGYEEKYQNGHITYYYYVDGADGNSAVYTSHTQTGDKVYCIDRDHLGSVTALFDQNGNKCFSASFDPWGRRYVEQGSIEYDRGYTGHEHIDELGLIDMNGRMYDPILGRFISVDPYIQEPYNPQNFNRYAYCLNNPLRYTDPSGEFVWAPIIIGAIMGGTTGGIIGHQKGATGWNMVGYIAGGALIGGLSAGISLGIADAGYVISGMYSGYFSGTMFSGMASGWDTNAMLSGFVSGMISGGLSGCFQPLFGYDSVGMINGILADGALGATTGFVTGGVTSIIMGRDFMDGALTGMVSGAITGAVVGGLRGYSNAETLGVNKFLGGTLEERGQAWANYYEFENVTIKPINNSTIAEFNEHSTTYTLENNMGEILATVKATGKEYTIDGVAKINSRTIYLTKSTIRHASFNSGWGKGTFFHEYTHVINKSTDEYLPYLVGYEHGGVSYFRRNEMMMKAKGINRY